MAEHLEIKFDFDPRGWQKTCLENQTRFTVLAVHRRAGKTTLALSELILKCLQAPYSDGVYAYIAPELNQARRNVWRPLKDMCGQFQKIKANGTFMDFVEIRESELSVTFGNGNKIVILGSDNPDNLRGIKFLGVVVDEVAQMPKESWNEVIYPALMDTKGFALFIGTPKGVNLFSTLFEQGLDPAFQAIGWSSAKFTCYDTKVFSEEDIENYKLTVEENVFRREMLCDFDASSTNQLVSIFEANEASERTYDESLLGSQRLILGVDVARFGADRSVLCFRRGLVCEEPIAFHGLDIVQLTRVIKQYVDERQPNEINIDGTGVGGGLVDNLNALGVFANDINFGHKSYNQEFKNLRTEMWCKMASWIKRGGILPKSLVGEVAMPTYDVDERNTKILESKKQIRDRLGKSPDLADALALTFAFDNPPIGLDPNQDVVFQGGVTNDILRAFGMQTRELTPFERFEKAVGNNLYDNFSRSFNGRRFF